MTAPGQDGSGPDPFEPGWARSEHGRTAARAAGISIASNAAQLLVMLGATAVLARLLTPRDFGLIAMAFTLVEFATTFRDAGLASAAVQREAVTHAQMSRLFWRNLRTAGLVMLLLVGGGPALAAFYGAPELSAICAVLSVGVGALAMTQLHLGLLRRQMRFARISAVDVSAVTVGALFGIAAALAGAGYWSLVVQQVTLFLLQAAGLWWASGWRPAPPRDSAQPGDLDVAEMVSYGRFTAMARLVAYLGKNGDQVIIGRVSGPEPLGLYKRAFTLSTLPFTAVHTPLSKVAQSSLSRLQSDPERFRQSFRTAAAALFGVTLPATAFVVVAAEDVVLILLGDQWLGAVDLLRILAAGAFLWAVSQTTKWLYLAEGRTRRQFTWSVISALVTLAGVGIGAAWGTTGVALGYALATGALAPAAVAYCLPGSRVRLSDWRDAVVRPALASLSAAAAVVPLTGAFGDWSPWQRIVPVGLAFTVAVMVAWAALPGGPAQLRLVGSAIWAIRRGGRRDGPP